MNDTARGGILLFAALVWAGAVVILANVLAPLALGQDPTGSIWRNGFFTLFLFGLLAAPPLVLLGRRHAWSTLRGVALGRWTGLGLAMGVGGFTITMSYAWFAGVLIPAAAGWVGFVPFAFGTLVVLFQSASEELFFRGWLQSDLEKRWDPRWALAATAIGFAALHVIGGARAPLSLINLLLGGVLFGLLAQRSGGLAASIAAHGGWNWAEQMVFGTDPNPGRTAFGALFDHDLLGNPLWGGSPEGINASIAMTIVLAALIAPVVALSRRHSSLYPATDEGGASLHAQNMWSSASKPAVSSGRTI